MVISERIQSLVRQTDTGIGLRILWTLVVILAMVGLTAWYDLWEYRGFSAPEAMDAAQVARNLEEGHGYSTEFIRPFSLYLLQKKQHAADLAQLGFAKRHGFYPDLANAPVYPTVLAGLFKISNPQWPVNLKDRFWSDNGGFRRYQPEFFIAVFNQFLLLMAVVLTFFIARKLFDPQAAWLAALLTLGSNLLWKFSVSGLSTSLLLVIFLGLVLCLLKMETLARDEQPAPRRLFGLAIAVGVLAGLGMLTRYSFGWVMVPVLVFLALFGGARRTGLAVMIGLIFAAIVTPWLARNFAVSGTFFGTAGYAFIENTSLFPGSKLLQSSSPDMTGNWVQPLMHKLAGNSLAILQGDLPHLGGWAAVLFFAGLLLGLRNIAARRLRYFTLICLGVFIIIQALGRTAWAGVSPELNSDNLLVLLTPLVIIFGIAFFLTLLDQMNFPAFEIRYAVIILLAVIMWLPLVATLLPPQPSSVAYPPYDPPEIQRVSGWLGQDELMMSDMPWAVAWYGRHPCIWNTLDVKDDFYAINDYFQPVKAIYLTAETLDDKFFSNMARGRENSWGHFALEVGMKSQFPKGFPLETPKILVSGLLLTDRPRWPVDQ